MKSRFSVRSVVAFSSLLIGASAASAADSGKSKSELRTLEPDRHENIEKERVTFLGVETAPVSETLSAQLGLPRGAGLVVSHVVPKSPAESVLREHDILLKLDDQLLIETRQLSVLIRNHNAGDEVSLTYVRAGQEATAKVKLGTHEVPKFSVAFAPEGRAFAFSGNPAQFHFVPGAPENEREHVDRLLSLIKPLPSSGARVHVSRNHGPGLRAISVNPGNSNLVYSDDDGSLELAIKDGVKTLVAKNAKGEELFSGPVTTPEERKALPAEVRARLERLEGMHDITFRTDGEFRGAEMKVLRPPSRGIALPALDPPAPPGASPRF